MAQHSKQNSDHKVMFKSFSSVLSPGFWQTLSQIKLNDLGLSEEPIGINGSYSCGKPCQSKTQFLLDCIH